ncbi:MAG: efflux RND transporter periplasmic adaptor subunit [Melioribacteraceae bacterium]|nr:efflux RND transporter periplasmic adaptor subunit [Melioribacteraceae bacterium]
MAKTKGKKSKKKVVIFGGIFLLAVVVILLVAFGGNDEHIISVDTEEVTKRDITQVVAATGKIYPEFQIIITPEVTGEIVELPFEEGDHVEKGDLLIRIKPDIYIAQRNKAQANLESSQANLSVREALYKQYDADFKRIQGLFEKGLASTSELERAESAFYQRKGELEAQKASVAQSKESLSESEEQLAKTAINSPLTGTISQLNVERGERILGSGFSQGTNLMTVADLTKMEARVEVDENDVVLVSVGDTARIEIDAFGEKKFLGIVSQIGNSAQTTGFGTQDEVVNFEVKIAIDLEGQMIRPGMSCDSDVETETRKSVLSVPIQSVTARTEGFDKDKKDSTDVNEEPVKTEDQEENSSTKKQKPKEVVFIANDGSAKMLPVKTGISNDSYIEITEGLEGGERIISGPYRAISKELKNEAKVIDRSKKGKDAKKETKN